MTVAKPVRQTISFTEDEYEEFIYGGIGYRIVRDEITDHRRWSVVHAIIIEREEDNTFWCGTYEHGATESQDYGWADSWGNKKAIFTQVFPKTVTTVVYE